VKFFQELRRRNVFKVAIAYGVTAWILMQLTQSVSDTLALPDWVPKLVMLILVVGLVPALILTWIFEITPEGIKLETDVVREQSVTRKTGRKLDYIIIALMGVSLGVFVWKSRFEQKTAEFQEAATEAVNRAAEAQRLAEAEAIARIHKNSVAVLPFANHSTNASDLYFTDGIHDDLLTQLSKIDALSVISRTSVMDYRDTTKSLRQIALELGVASIMEGSVQRSGHRVRINVQLIDALTGKNLWAEIFDQELTTSNLFDIQAEIAKAITTALKATLSESEMANVGNVPTQSVAAYDLYLQGKQFEFEETREGFRNALERYRKALNEDPEFALAWIGLARAYITNYWSYGGNPDDRERAREAIDRAKSIDAKLSELYMAEGFYWYWGHLDYDRALYNLSRAIELTPGNYEAYMWRGWASRRSGLWKQSLESMQRALELNPRVYINWVEYGLTYLYLHRYEEARQAFEKAAAINADHPWVKEGLSRLALQQSGDAQKAVMLTTGVQASGDPTFVEGFINARLYARHFEEALQTARSIPDTVEVQRHLITLREDWAAQILHYMGRRDESRDAANAALFRLQGLRSVLGNDYRIDLPEARLHAILDENDEAVRARAYKAMTSSPEDKVDEFRIRLEVARIYATAGLAADCVELLSSLLLPPSETTWSTVSLDPAFDSIRNAPEFVAMMERRD